MSRDDRKEVWEVVIKDRKRVGFLAEYFVFATSAANAEMRGIRLATMDSDVEDCDDLYCTIAQFHCYVF